MHLNSEVANCKWLDLKIKTAHFFIYNLVFSADKENFFALQYFKLST